MAEYRGIKLNDSTLRTLMVEADFILNYVREKLNDKWEKAATKPPS